MQPAGGRGAQAAGSSGNQDDTFHSPSEFWGTPSSPCFETEAFHELRRAGGSVSATLPSDIVQRFHLQPGDKIYIQETDRGILLTPYDPEFDQALEVYRRGARKYRNALHELGQ